MFKIGDFSKISRVSVKTLHHYDEIGLLKPIQVDDANSYRYYSIDQLPRLNRILVLKDLGFSLEQIAVMLGDHLSSVELRGMLRMKQAKLQELVREEQARLARVEARLKQIEQEDAQPTYDIVIKQIEPVMIACAREIMPSANEMFQRCAALADKIVSTLMQEGVMMIGPWCAIYHVGVEYTGQDENMDVEMAVVVDKVSLNRHISRDHEQVLLRELPGGTIACLVHPESYDTLLQSYIAVLHWIDATGYSIVGPSRMVYLRAPGEGDPITEIQLPVVKKF